MTWSRLALRLLLARAGAVLAASAGVAIAVAMVGASLVVGESLRGTLRAGAHDRVGAIEAALVASGRTFREALAQDLSRTGPSRIAPVFFARGSVEDPEGGRVVTGVDVWGVDARFTDVFGRPASWVEGFEGTKVAISPSVAAALAGRPASLLVRVEQSGDLPRESPLAGALAPVQQLFVDEVREAGTGEGGGLSLVSEGEPARVVFVPLATLQERLALDGRVNVLLVSGAVDGLQRELQRVLTLDDLAVTAAPVDPGTVLRTDRIFLDPPTQAAVRSLSGADSRTSLSYFVNALSVGDRTTPYSIVTAIEGEGAPGDDEVVLGRWLADDLAAKAGDVLRVRYYVPAGPGGLEERTADLRAAGIVPTEALTRWRAHVPTFPGVADKANCREWEPGMPVELARIRDVDEAYWDDHGLTPKALVSLSTGRKLWANRWGEATAIASAKVIDASMRIAVDPGAVGLSWLPVGPRARASSTPSVDFSGLFLALGFLVVVTALLLAVQLVVAGVEDRAGDAETLRAVGFGPGLVRRFLGAELAFVLVLGGVFGFAASFGLGAGAVTLLNGRWADAAAGLSIAIHWPVVALVFATLGVVAISGASALPSLRRAGTVTDVRSAGPGAGFRAGSMVIGIAGVSAGFVTSGLAQVVLPVVGGLGVLAALASSFLTPRDRSGTDWASIQAQRNPSRRVLLACVVGLGVFLVALVGGNRHGTPGSSRTSGTGGFGALVKLDVPLVKDPRSPDAAKGLDLDPADLAALAPVPLRVSPGDDASCRTLGQAVRPTVIGVESAAFAGRFGASVDWSRLDAPGEAVPVMGDEGTLRWGLKLGVGDRVGLVGEGDRAVPGVVAAIVPNNVLQGALVVSRARFESFFPSEPGFRWFLVEGPPDRIPPALERFVEALSMHGTQVQPTAARLASLLAVENAYLSVFLATGLLSLLLGCLGVVVVTWRDVVRRRSEFALLAATGWEGRHVRGAVRREFASTVGAGLLAGLVSSVVVLSVLVGAAGLTIDLPGLATGLPLVVVLVSIGTWWAADRAVARVTVAALKEE